MRTTLLLALFGFVLLATVSAQPVDIDDIEEDQNAEQLDDNADDGQNEDDQESQDQEEQDDAEGQNDGEDDDNDDDDESSDKSGQSNADQE
ncbi:prostatic spermine-binding protein [Drosophila pseudoobscura]|uniref:Prostatic spermine-binding protein n=1 Tax=Drosophila pseudoobscura pseudoobscura TaxID=46245 RepID=A0A6I8WAD5_DROPS|nr:prostatic spermine-binding protein [Drosophila pseudoobscura]